MGFEYQFKVTDKDIETLSRYSGRIRDLETLVESGLQVWEDARESSDQAEERWRPEVSLNDAGILLCIYDPSAGSPDVVLMDYLIYELLRRCGRVEIEDA